jgi:predicted nucleotidyltransferase
MVLTPHASAIAAAFVYGSVAKGTDRAGSDIDLMVISNSLRYADLFSTLQSLEAELGRPINPTVMTPAAWRARRSRKDSFASRITSHPRGCSSCSRTSFPRGRVKRVIACDPSGGRATVRIQAGYPLGCHSPLVAGY